MAAHDFGGRDSRQSLGQTECLILYAGAAIGDGPYKQRPITALPG